MEKNNLTVEKMGSRKGYKNNMPYGIQQQAIIRQLKEYVAVFLMSRQI
jgi:hypothetical protein